MENVEKDRIQELLAARAQADQLLEKMRTPITILFSDIKGSTAYFEREGDVKGLAMVQRHNDLLFPVIESCGGRVVKTIGDAIMASFLDPAGAVKAAIGMQRALDGDRKVRAPEEQIHIRVGLHTGLGLLKDNDVFGDVVNAASRVQHQAEPDQILITDVLLAHAKSIGAQCAKMGRAEMKGKDEPIDVFAVAWSSIAGEQLIEELQARFDRKTKELKKHQDEMEEEFEVAREQWRAERRRLATEIEELEEAAEKAQQVSLDQVSADLQSELRFQLQESQRMRSELEQESGAAELKWEAERTALRSQISAMQASVLEAMERSNNPARLALAVREGVEARLQAAKKDWQLEWEAERRRLTAELERLKKTAGVDERKEAAKLAILQKLGKAPAGSTPATSKTSAQWARELEDARMQWETEKDQLSLRIQQLERAAQSSTDIMRSEVFQEIRAQYEPKLVEANAERRRLDLEVTRLSAELDEERARSRQRCAALEMALPEAQESARRQVMAELRSEYDVKVEELNRLKNRAERRVQDQSEEAEAQSRRLRKQVSQLEEQLKEARESAYRAQRMGQSPGSQ